jgi:calpain-15
MNLFITRKKNPNGFYCVQLCLEGVWTAITIDDLFPTNNGKPAYTRSDAKEIWVMILEKAWAKAYGDYGNIEAGLAKYNLI